MRSLIQTLLIVALCCPALLIGCTPSRKPDAPGERPSFLFLLADDQRADTIAALGNPHIDTPNLDRLVRQGFTFKSNYNMGGNNGAVCVPSRAMINSGRAYFRVRDDLENVPILPELLGRHGYATFGTGKWHNGETSWKRGFEQGQSVFFGGMSDHTRLPLVDFSEDGRFVNQRIGQGFSSELIANAAIDFIRNYGNPEPFYAYVAFTAPHDPRQPPESFRESYYRRAPPLPSNFLPQHPFNLGSWLTVRDEVLAPWPRTPDVITDQLAEYYGLISHLDEQIGRVLRALEESAHADRTVIVFAADHGLALGSHGLLGKQNLYEHSQRCPLIFSGPGIPHGESESLTYLVDIFPTLLGIAGVEPLAEVDGRNLLPIWSDRETRVRESLFLGFTDQARSIRDEKYKLILYPRINHRQLFDLTTDPDERVDLADDPAHQTRIEEMTQLLREWQTRLGDAQPLSMPNPEPISVDLTDRERTPDKWQPAWIVEKYF